MPYYPPPASVRSYNLIQNEGTSLTAQTTLDFVGAGVIASDADSKTQILIPGSAGSVSSGTATLDFGTFPGSSDTSVAVMGQAGIIAASRVWCWIYPNAATVDHTIDEHIVETIVVYAGNIIAGTGFTIYGKNTNILNEPLLNYGERRNHIANATLGQNTGFGGNTLMGSFGGRGTLIYGTWLIGWAWV